MPAIQVIDELNPRQYEGENALVNTLDEFRQRQVAENDRSGLQKIYGKYQQDRANIDDAILSAQTERGLSPTARVNGVNTLLALKKQNDATAIAQVKQLNAKKSKADITDEAKKVTKDKLVKAGLPEQLSDLWSEATEGGKTQLMKYLVDRAEWDPQANKYIETLTGLQGQTAPENTPSAVPPQSSSPEAGQQSPTSPTPQPKSLVPIEDDSKLPPKERNDRQEKRYTTQLPLFNEHIEAEKDIKSTSNDIEVLTKLNDNDNIEEHWYDDINFNPFTGDILLPKLANPEAQLYAKTIKNFIKKAKSFFPGRVTNFDLAAFEASLPRLNNSKEGRALILKQMDVANKIMELESDAFTKVVRDEYGIRNIDWPDAQRIANDRIKDKKSQLETELKDVYSRIKTKEEREVEEAKKKIKKGNVLLRRPDGKLAEFPEKNVDVLVEKQKYKRV